jgi:hypothetical protein
MSSGVAANGTSREICSLAPPNDSEAHHLPHCGSPATARRKAIRRESRPDSDTRDDIPSRLIVGRDIPPAVAELYQHMCPAGVYDRRDDDSS